MADSNSGKSKSGAPSFDIEVLNSIASRAHYFAVQMIQIANHRSDKEKGDPKVGGHPAASASSLHILGALHLVVKSGFDHIAVKPHASPADHSYNYLLDLLFDKKMERLTPDSATKAMHHLRHFSQTGEPVFQSYHSIHDPDGQNFFPSGTVGIPPVNAGYLAHAYRFARNHGYKVPSEAHFWSLIGDSEFREGSLSEAMPDFAEREIGNLTWILDYNRQSLDGHRITNEKVMEGSDDQRIERTAVANGWEVIQVKHGQFRQNLFGQKHGQIFQRFLDEELPDYQLQALLLCSDAAALRKIILSDYKHLSPFLNTISDEDLLRAIHDMGGHDFQSLIDALEASKKSKKPSLVIAHTIKGWGLKSAAAAGNHSALPSSVEVEELRKQQNLSEKSLFQKFSETSREGRFLKTRGEFLHQQILKQRLIKHENTELFKKEFEKFGGIPDSFGINTKLVTYPHTQWMLGQITAKMTRISNTSLSTEGLEKGQRSLTDEEKGLKIPSELLVSMAPDVGTSTNLNPAMDGKVFGAIDIEDYEAELDVKDTKLPDLVPGEEKSDRFLRFEIAECNVMSCVGSYGKLRDVLGIPLLPLMTVYDFFIKRAHDQYFYNLYWNSSFILVGTPSGVTLSPEGAQHGWKSDFQIPGQITWEPFFCLELDWIFAESMKRHLLSNNDGRSGVLIRGVTRGVDQTILMHRLRRHRRFKQDSSQTLALSDKPIFGSIDEGSLESQSDEMILQSLREDVLAGGYYLIDYRGYGGYEPGDNVVNVFAMGSLGTEAVKASDALLEMGIYANVIMITSPDLLIGGLGYENGYRHLKEGLGVSEKHNFSEQASHNASGMCVPIISVHDGEPGLLDNIGSIVGVRHESLAIRKHSKCGRPSDIYAYHHIDSASIVQAAQDILTELA